MISIFYGQHYTPPKMADVDRAVSNNSFLSVD